MSELRRLTLDQIDIQKWEALVSQQTDYSYHASVAFLSWLESPIDFVVLGDYDGGMVLPVKKKWGIEVVYTPFFLPFSRWMGKGVTFEELFVFLQKEVQELNFLLHFPGELPFPTRCYQVWANKGYKTQTQRSLKKAERHGFEWMTNPDLMTCARFVTKELLQKDIKLSPNEGEKLIQILVGLQKKGKLHTLALQQEGQLVACQFFIEQNKRFYYLKGAAQAEAMKNGAMYYLMHRQLTLIQEKGGTLDFGGSHLEGIRQFYLNLGGEDRYYFHVQWTKAPFWYRCLKFFRNKIVGK